MDFVCPICKSELALTENLTKRCKNGHAFDRARAGYYNLLVGSSGGTHGDNKEMVNARTAFLSEGFYSPLRDRVAELVYQHIGNGTALLDVGCGEGYYTSGIIEKLRAIPDLNMLAFDISRDAVKRLLAREKNVSAAVASAYDMPIADESIDVATLLFSPLATTEIHRTLKTGGIFIMVFPDVMHLYGLKAAIYDTPYKNKPEATELSGFTLLSDEQLQYEITVSGESLRNLFMMTPYAYRTSEANKKRLFERESVSTEVAFRILVYRKD